MAKSLGRWRCSTSLLGDGADAVLPSAANAGGTVRSRTHDAAYLDDQEGEGDEPHGRVTHTYVYLPVGWLTQPAPARRRTTHDAVALLKT
jgi:hypothetical protein